MRPPAATSRRLSPGVTTPGLIFWRSTRHLMEESRYPDKINTNETCRCRRCTSLPMMGWRDGVFPLTSFYFVVVLSSCFNHCLPVQQ